MRKQLSEEKYSFIHQKDKDFIIAFDEAMLKFGYESDGTIDNGFCWGRYMIINSKAGVNDYAQDYMKMGKWLMFQVNSETSLKDYKLLMSVKLHPKKQEFNEKGVDESGKTY